MTRRAARASDLAGRELRRGGGWPGLLIWRETGDRRDVLQFIETKENHFGQETRERPVCPQVSVQSFLGVTISNIGVNEEFAAIADDYIGNNWPLNTAGGLTLPSTGQFADTMCVTDPGFTLTTRVLTPQSPLTGVKIDHSTQSWFIGSLTPAV